MFWHLVENFQQGDDVAFEPAKLLWLIQRDFLRKLVTFFPTDLVSMSSVLDGWCMFKSFLLEFFFLLRRNLVSHWISVRVANNCFYVLGSLGRCYCITLIFHFFNISWFPTIAMMRHDNTSLCFISPRSDFVSSFPVCTNIISEVIWV